jgi:hypothetical protein
MDTHALSINQGDGAIGFCIYKYLAGALRKEQYPRVLGTTDI